jgi:2Fe-2S ferredoxin
MTRTPVKNISVTICYEGKVHEIKTYTNEYRSLMMLIYDQIYPEGFGDCLGMGKCGTCLVEIISSIHEPSYYERNEEMTLLRTGVSGKEVHLSCQIMIDEFIDGIKVNML